MTTTIQHIEDLRNSAIADVNAVFDLFIEKHFKEGDTFLQDLEDAGKQEAETEEPKPEIPDLDNIPEVQELKEKFDLEQAPGIDESFELVTKEDERYQKILEWIILKGAQLEALENFMLDKKIRLEASVFEHLKDLIWFRNDPEFDAKLIRSQNLSEGEMKLFEQYFKNIK